LEAYIAQWKKLELEFDCIYSGFLGSVKQTGIVEDFIRHFKTKENLVVVDPVMGDNGSLYSTMGPAMIREMRSLIGVADIITPNFTEAAFLLDRPYTDYIDDVSVKEWAIRLSEMGPATVVITSVPDHRDNADTSVIAYDRTNQICWKISCRYIPAHYPGTGDTFTSVVIGGLLQGDSLPIALDRGVLFISQCIKASYGFNYPKREGVLLERCLDILKAPAVIGAFETL
ncbi:MAG TPA: pyridoxamine kinase, partial [Clostridiales bacterium]|nr:pyridoxamine kinase [Clostridiales bacterium]